MSIEPGHRTAVDFLMGHMLLLRGENRRTMQLADCFPMPLKNEGPRFQRRQDWYDWHLLRGRDVLTPLSYEVQLEWTNKMFKAAEVTALKKTHSRGQGSQEAERGSVSER